MASSTPLFLFDSNIITKLVEDQPEAAAIQLLVENAAQGHSRLVISTVAMLEASRQPYVFNPVKVAKLIDFFENDYIEVVDLDVTLAQEALLLIDDYQWLRPMDAAHVATALRTGCIALYTTDADLINRLHRERGLQVLAPGTPLESDLGGFQLFEGL